MGLTYHINVSPWRSQRFCRRCGKLLPSDWPRTECDACLPVRKMKIARPNACKSKSPPPYPTHLVELYQRILDTIPETTGINPSDLRRNVLSAPSAKPWWTDYYAFVILELFRKYKVLRFDLEGLIWRRK